MRYVLGVFLLAALSLVEIVGIMFFVMFVTNRTQAKQDRSPVTWRQMLHNYPLFAVGLSVVILSINGGIATFVWLIDRVGPRAAAVLLAMMGAVCAGAALSGAGALQARNRLR